MQIENLYIVSTVAAVIATMALAGYLIMRWSKQPARMYSDLPFVFGVTFIMQSINMLMQSLVYAEMLPDTLDVLRVRSFVIAGTAFPMFGALLAIWAPRQRKHYWKIILLLVIYWVAVTLFAPDAQVLQGMLIPILLVMMVGLAATFAITWRTGRLKEVRSDLMLLCLVLIIISQLTRLTLMSLGLVFIADTINVAATLIATVALVNPWYRRTAVTGHTETRVTDPQ